MRILVISHYAGSRLHGMIFGPYHLAKEWARRGHEVTIVAASFAHVRNRQPEVRGDITEERIDGIRYVWLKTPSYKGNNTGRVINILAFLARLAFRGDSLPAGNAPDVVISSSAYVLDILPAWRIAGKMRAMLIFEVRDLWPLTPIMLGNMSRLHPFIMALRQAEGFAYRHSDKVVSVLPNAREYMVSRGMAPDKFVHIPNGIDPVLWAEDRSALPDLHSAELRKLKERNLFLVGFTGSHGKAADLDTLVKAAEVMKKIPAAFVLVGGGSEKAVLQAMVRERRLDRVIFLPPVPKSSMPALLDAMDALYIGLKRHPLWKWGVSPNKLLEYMMAGKPIIHGIQWANDIVRESGCGISIRPEDPREIARAVESIMGMNIGERAAMGSRGKEYVLKHHDYRVLAEQYIQCMTTSQ
jgi:glycosyltransferase involved in cell wall biosynthesis